MEQLKQSQLKYIIKKLPVIQIKFDDYDTNWRGKEEGIYHNERYEIQEDDIFVILDLYVSSTYSLLSETLITPKEHTRESSTYELMIKTVMIEEDEYTLTPKQLRQLEKAIINNLEY